MSELTRMADDPEFSRKSQLCGKREKISAKRRENRILSDESWLWELEKTLF